MTTVKRRFLLGLLMAASIMAPANAQSVKFADTESQAKKENASKSASVDSKGGAKSKSNGESPGADALSVYDKSLVSLEPDKSIRLLCTPLNKALCQHNYQLAARIMRMIAIAFHLDENDEAAEQAVRLASRLDPANIDCRFQLADYEIKDGYPAAGAAIYKELCKNPDRKTANRASAFINVLSAHNNHDSQLMEVCYKENPENETVIRALAGFYRNDGKTEELLDLEAKLLKLAPTEYLKKLIEGQKHEIEKNYTDADKCYVAAGELMPADPLWHYRRAQLNMLQHKETEATKEFRQCLASRRMLGKAYSTWAVTEAFLGSVTNAKSGIDYALKLHPRNGDMYFAKGVIQEKAGESKSAEESFARAIELNPRNHSAYIHLIQLGDARKISGKEREQLCRSWHENIPNSISACIELGNTLRRCKRDDEALKVYLRGEEIMRDRNLPSDKILLQRLCIMHANIADIFYAKKDLGAALKEAEVFNSDRPAAFAAGGIAIRPGKINLSKTIGKAHDAAVHALMADIFYECGNLRKADEEYSAALTDDPDNMDYHSSLLKVLLDKKDYAKAAKEDAAVSQHFITHISDIFFSKK